MRLIFNAAFLLALLVSPTNVSAQEFTVESRVNTTGTVRAVHGQRMTIADAGGEVAVYLIQSPGDSSISIEGDRLSAPAEISVSGNVSIDVLQPGNVVAFSAALGKTGKETEPLKSLELLTNESGVTGVEVIDEPEGERFANCEAVVTVQRLKKGRLTANGPPGPYTGRGRVLIDLADDATLSVKRNDLGMVQPGDTIRELSAVKLTTGHLIIQSIDIELQSDRDADASTGDLDPRYARLSDEPSPARDVRSRNFMLHTDVSDRQGQILLDKLETMIDLVSRYYGRPPQGLIECYVVRDLKSWPPGTFPLAAAQKILEPAGVTMSRSLGRQRQTIAYSCDDHQTVQHECVHAYCYVAFGSAGPVWYAEGMAEMGAYWEEGQLAVDIQPGVIRYLTQAEPKKMANIVAAGQVTGDSWQAYAWRWALCHLLANNPNYSSRLKGLGIGMMSGDNVSFESVYGDVAPQISFEYDQFVENFGNGYRADLCAWQWNVKPRRLGPNRDSSIKVSSQRGWQATEVQLEQGNRYHVSSAGEWKIVRGGNALTVDGDGAGNGKLIGAVFANFELGEPFELGSNATFTAPSDGQLVLRCRDKWTQLAENEGEIEVTVRAAAE